MATLITTIFVIGSLLNPFLDQLLDRIRSARMVGTDSLWKLYIENLKNEQQFSEHTEQLGGLTRIKDYEIKFVNEELSEAEFCYWIGYEFSRDIMPMESEWFLNKSESLGFVCAEMYLMPASNYETEWNNYLHYNEDLSEPYLKYYEDKWRESLKKFIALSKDSIAVEKVYLQLTCIYSPFRTPQFINEFAPVAIKNLEDFIKEHSRSSFVEEAYTRLVWWLSETERFEKLKKACLNFLKKYSSSTKQNYMKMWLGISYLEMGDTLNAKKILMSVRTDSLPQSVYPGWMKDYIIELYKNKLFELKK